MFLLFIERHDCVAYPPFIQSNGTFFSQLKIVSGFDRAYHSFWMSLKQDLPKITRNPGYSFHCILFVSTIFCVFLLSLRIIILGTHESDTFCFGSFFLLQKYDYICYFIPLRNIQCDSCNVQDLQRNICIKYALLRWKCGVWRKCTTRKTDNIVQQFPKKETMSKRQNQPKVHYVQQTGTWVQDFECRILQTCDYMHEQCELWVDFAFRNRTPFKRMLCVASKIQKTIAKI